MYLKKNLKYLSSIILVIFFVHCSSPYMKRIPPTYQTMVKEALQKAGKNRSELVAFLNDCNDEEITGAAFLLSYMPERDLTTLTKSFLSENLKYAYLARKQTKWGKLIPDSLFLNYVLPYSNMHERRDNWRKDFYQKFIGLVKDSNSPGEAALILNKKIWDIVNVHYSTKRPKADQSPYESIEAGLASCTGLAILLVDACRSVGIPARFTGVPMWYDNIGNHSWVEIWDNGWHFIESVTSDTLDKAWFRDRAGHANHSAWQYGIYALSFKKTGLPYHDIFDSTANYLWAVDVTDRYSKVDESKEKVNLRIVVKGKIDKKRIPAKVQLMDGNKIVAEGFSRGERNDMNDMLNFNVKQNHGYVLIITYKGKKIERKIRTNEKKEMLVQIFLPEI